MLKSCPDSPNCVSSLSPEERHYIKPFSLKGGSKPSLASIRLIVLSMNRTRLIEETETYLHFEIRTLLGFRDDVEFFFSTAEQVIHVRSSSRTGYWDFGVNRRRVEYIRQVYESLIRERYSPVPV